MDLQLKNKIAIISGASKGIGAATALELAKEGTHLVLIARNKDAVEKIANDLKSSYPVKVLPITADMPTPRKSTIGVSRSGPSARVT